MQIFRISLDSIGGEVRWVDRVGVVAATMTQRSGNVLAIQLLVKSGRVSMHEEKLTFGKHKE